MTPNSSRPGEPLDLTPLHPATSPAKPSTGFGALPSAQGGRARNTTSLGWKIVKFGLFGLVGLFLLVGLAYAVVGNPFKRGHSELLTHTIRRESLPLSIVERGGLESAENRDVVCRVKARTQGQAASNFKWVIDDGTVVKKGDLLADLDDSALEDQLKNQKIVVDKAEADKIQTEENYKIVRSQNESDIKTAEVNLELAEIDLKKYQEGDYPQQLKIDDGNIKTAESDLEQQRDRVAWANRMVKKGYYTVTQAQGEQSKMESLEIALAKALEDKRVLTDPIFGTGKRQITFLQNNVAETKRALERVKSQTTAKEIQARSDREAKKSVYDQEMTRYNDIKEEIKKCRITAPQDGLVVYFVPEQSRFGMGSQQSIVAQGEPVREGQKLMRIPNLDRMVVNTKVHEAMVSRVKAGQEARVRVDAFPNRILKAHVEQVATVASQQDFLSADVKVYQTTVAIDEKSEGLKPGMSAEVTITVGATLEDVLAIPVQAVIGSVELGKKRECFVLTPHGPEKREIELGHSNDRMAEVRSGLVEGDAVVMNPRVLVGDKAKIREPNGKNKRNGENTSDAPEKGEKKGSGPMKVPGPKSAPGNGAPPIGATPGGPPAGGPAVNQEKMLKDLSDRFRKATPEERKQMLAQFPDEHRDKMKQALKGQGIDVPE